MTTNSIVFFTNLPNENDIDNQFNLFDSNNKTNSNHSFNEHNTVIASGPAPLKLKKIMDTVLFLFFFI